MNTWTSILSPLLIWSVQFFGLYIIAEFAPQALEFGALAMTFACLALIAWSFARSAAAHAWPITVARWGRLIVAVAIVWQALPVIMS